MGLLNLNFERLYQLLPVATLEERKIGMSLTLHNLNSFAKKYFVAHLITSALISFYCGFVAGAVVLILMLLNASGIKVILEDVKAAFDAKKIDVDEAEKRLWIHPFSRSLISGIIYLLFVNSNEEHSSPTAAFFAGATIIIILNQTAGNFKFLLAGLLPVLALICADAVSHIIFKQDFTVAIAPFSFVILMSTISLTVAKDKINGAKLILANINKTNALLESIKKIEDEKRVQEIVEKLAKVGKFNWFFEGKGKSYWSVGAFEIFGFAQADMPPKREEFVARIVDKDLESYFKTMEDCRFSGKPYELQFSIKDGNGNVRHVITNGAPIFDEHGNSIGMEGIVVDQTYLREALNIAQENKKLFDSIN